MSFLKYFLYIATGLIISIFSGCASSTFKVNSDPLQADVFVVNPKTGERKIIGKTPINMPNEEFRNLIGEDVSSGEFYTVVIEKPGFGTQSFSLPASKFGTLVTNLDVKLKQGGVEKELRIAQEILDHLFLAQKFANLAQFERAHIEIDKVLSPFPTFARALSMRASIYFAQKNFSESLKWYEETVKSDSQAEEAVKMIGKVKDIIAGKNPTSLAKAPPPKSVEPSAAKPADVNRAPASPEVKK
ncbi:MAG: hypothetical protein H7061_04260 [Bdellovibrionaceae bacterium]|nr:hypothetical protein [Bdellovibrio sp.]